MASSRYHLPGAFHSRVLRCNLTGDFFIIVPDVKAPDRLILNAQVFEVHHEPRSDSSATYQVFRMGERRSDLEVGFRLVGAPWGTHTILEPGAYVPWSQVDEFKTQFRGTGCLVALIAIPATFTSLCVARALFGINCL